MPEQSPTQKALDEATERLCFNYSHTWVNSYRCKFHLRPLTSDGEDCPYFDREKEEELNDESPTTTAAL